jgi:hypothetical protein
MAKITTDHGLYEEALTIYKKYDQHAMAINVSRRAFGADLLSPNLMACG